ncbi:hypothetical protein F5Y16DRAFT_394023 [Xylariaceae sp. FL0255]|nr:hypothetical protein F5Y16DRAFT_394023 [Xylariaceae sp. FL0255]
MNFNHGPDILRYRPSLQSMTPPEMDGDESPDRDVGSNLDHIVHRLNRKPLLHDSLRHRFLDDDGEVVGEFESESLPTTTTIPSQSTSTSLAPIPEVATTRVLHQPHPSCPVPRPCSSSHNTPAFSPPPSFSPPIQQEQPVLHQPQPQLQLQSQSQLQFTDNNRSGAKLTEPKRLRRHTDTTRLHRSASNLRTLDLMVENGVQCNVQLSTPPTPTRTSSACSVQPEPIQIAQDDDPRSQPPPSPPPPIPRSMELEVDLGFSEHDDDTMLSETLALRHASTPVGIRKLGYLRYRSSTEAALACKNMKRSAPRMRRRNGPSGSAASSAAASPLPSTS